MLAKLFLLLAAISLLICNQAMAQEDEVKIRLAARQAASIAAENAFKKWDDAQAKSTQQFDSRDHQTCVNAGFNPTTWGNPDTEKYYLCRAQLIEERSPPLPPNVSQLAQSRSALFFRQKAHEAQYAVRSIDEEAHYTCLKEAGTPGALENPQTKLYYECRTRLAEEQMGPKVASLFRQKALDAANATADAELCVQRGLKKEDPAYGKCRKQIAASRQCQQNIQTKITQKTQQDAIECKKEAFLKFPNQQTRKNARTTNIPEPNIAQKKFIATCLKQRQNLYAQYKTKLEFECQRILSTNY